MPNNIRMRPQSNSQRQNAHHKRAPYLDYRGGPVGNESLVEAGGEVGGDVVELELDAAGDIFVEGHGGRGVEEEGGGGEGPGHCCGVGGGGYC